MVPEEIGRQLKERLGEEKVLDVRTDVLDPYIRIAPDAFRQAAEILCHDPALAFDSLMCLSGVDYPRTGEIEVVYHLFSFRHRHRITVKVRVPRDNPHIPTVSDLWRTAEWHEREAYDLFGIVFDRHPDLRRILLPEDWEGFPLRKDYRVQDTYHDIPVPYNVREDFGKGTWIFEEAIEPGSVQEPTEAES